MSPSPRRRTAAVLGVAVALVSWSAALAGCGGETAPPPTATTGAPVAVSVSDCGSSWTPGPAGLQEVTLHNTDSRPGEVRLVGRDAGHRGRVFAEVEPFGPGTRVTIHPRLGAGRYAFECLMEEEPLITGPTATVTGTGRGGPGVLPVDQSELIEATQGYTRWVLRQLPALATEVAALRHDVQSGDLAGARAHWLRGHAVYERLGAAYDAFGDLDGAINGLPAGLPHGRADRGFTGFHRIELELWHHGSAADIGGRAAALEHAVGALHDQLAGSQLDPLELSVRAHEISENLLQTTLNGEDDLGSHSALTTLAAGLGGTDVVLGLLHHLLASRDDRLPRLTRALARDRSLVHRLARTSLAHRPVAAWPRAERQRLDAAIGGLCEQLASVAAMLEPRRTS